MRRFILSLLWPPYELARKHPFSGYILFTIQENLIDFLDALYRKKSARNLDQKTLQERFGGKLMVVSIAFNNATLIEKQIEYFKQNVTGAELVVADNSSDEDSREKVKAACDAQQIFYIDLPPAIINQANLSHSFALNWIYYNVINKAKPFGFGFIDHDMFPITPIDLSGVFNQTPLYGLYQSRSSNFLSGWYLWAGFSFFKYSFIEGMKLNFRSVVMFNRDGYLGLDTGGGNYDKLYKDLNPKDVRYATQTTKPDGTEFIDGWQHLSKIESRGLGTLN